jgi:excisionase family DNA binding protein
MEFYLMLQTITENTKAAYSIDEIAELTTLSKPFLRLEIKRGKLKVKRFGRRVLVLKDDLDSYLALGSDGGRDN